MIRNIVFDMGGVLLRFDPVYFIQRLEVAPEDEALLLREVFRSLEWVSLDRGSLMVEEAVERICRRVPQRCHDAVDKLVRMWDRPILPIEGMYELVEELKQAGYGVYLLSNASVRHSEYWPRLPASRFFDGGLISADVQLLKPQPEIYKLLLEKFSLRAEECFFVDDIPANVEGAVYCGMDGAVFHGDAARLRRELQAAGVALKS